MLLQGKSVLVTGGAGFLGSHLVDALVEKGATVTALDNLTGGTLTNLKRSWKSVRFIEADVRDREAVAKAVEGQAVVFHLAANANVPYSVENPAYDFETNALGSYNVFTACLHHQVERVIFSSSAAIYGNPVYAPMDENHPTNPVSPYGASKLAAEKLGLAYFSVYDFPFTAIRVFNTYGERQRRYVMYDLLSKLNKDPSRLEVLGDGRQRRDFCYVSDVCRALMCAAESDDAVGGVFNISGGSPVTIRELIDLILDLLGTKNTTGLTFTGSSWKGDIADLVGDSTRIKTVLGVSPQVGLGEGLTNLIRWLNEKSQESL